MAIKAERYDDFLYILRNEKGQVVGVAMQDESGKWTAHTKTSTISVAEYGEHDTPQSLAAEMSRKLPN